MKDEVNDTHANSVSEYLPERLITEQELELLDTDELGAQETSCGLVVLERSNPSEQRYVVEDNTVDQKECGRYKQESLLR
jgi:hypothetical protein